jgi:hypothetical protein
MESIERIQPKLPLYIERARNIDRSKPVNIVILFGWTNSSLKNVWKVASYWRKKGNFHILYYVAPSWPYIYFTNTIETITKKFIPFLKESGIFHSSNEQQISNKKPLLIAHCFSNGGSAGMASLIKACKAQSLTFRYSAIIIDSAPGTYGHHNNYKIYTAPLHNPVHKLLTFIYINILTSIGMPCLFIFFKFSGHKFLIDYITIALRNKMATNCPRLFIYSKKDELVPYERVQNEIKISKDLGFDTDILIFENSAHVKHWVDNQQAYEAKIDEFLSKRKLLTYRGRSKL